MLFYYVRHGDPIYHPDSLTPLGHKQAAAVAKRLALYGIDEIYASSSIRARQTAEPTCDLLRKEMTLCPWAHEDATWETMAVPDEDGIVDWGFRNPTILAHLALPEVKALGEDWYTHPAFENTRFGEGMQYIRTHTDEFFLSLGYRHCRERGGYEVLRRNPHRVAFFAHQGVGISFLSSLLDIPYPFFAPHFDLGHSSVTVIHFEDSRDFVVPRVLQLSNDSHLYHEGLLTGYHNEIDI